MMPGVARVQHALPPRSQQIVRVSANIVGAAGAAYFAYVTLSAYFHTHRPIGLLFFAQQAVVVVAYLVRRPASAVTLRFGDWLLRSGGRSALSSSGPTAHTPVGASPPAWPCNSSECSSPCGP